MPKHNLELHCSIEGKRSHVTISPPICREHFHCLQRSFAKQNRHVYAVEQNVVLEKYSLCFKPLWLLIRLGQISALLDPEAHHRLKSFGFYSLTFSWKRQTHCLSTVNLCRDELLQEALLVQLPLPHSKTESCVALSIRGGHDSVNAWQKITLKFRFLWRF